LFRRENRFDILIFECLLLGFFIGFISFYHHITYVLLVLLFIHIIGTLYTEKRFNVIKQGILTLSHVFIEICRLIINRITRRSPSKPKVLITKKLPEKYLYNYHLKPTNDLRLQQVRS
jgi:ABC-type iron transport system FetAB permease component